MALLSAPVRSILNQCAGIMSRREGTRKLDLSLLISRINRSSDELVTYLAEQVEAISHRQLTVRRADGLLFNLIIHGPALYVGGCPRQGCTEIVAEQGDEGSLCVRTPGLGLVFDRGISAEELDDRRADMARALDRQTLANKASQGPEI